MEPKFNIETKEITNGEYTMPVKIVAHPTDKYLIIDIFGEGRISKNADPAMVEKAIAWLISEIFPKYVAYQIAKSQAIASQSNDDRNTASKLYSEIQRLTWK